MVARTRITDRPNDPRHGTQNGYTNLRCRCEECRAAHTADWLARRAKRLPPPEGDPRHGSAYTYSNHNCRCRPCTDAVARACRERRQARKVA